MKHATWMCEPAYRVKTVNHWIKYLTNRLLWQPIHVITSSQQSPNCSLVKEPDRPPSGGLVLPPLAEWSDAC